MTEERLDHEEERPPFLGRWPNVYLLLLVQLCITIAVFYAITRWAS